MEVGDVFFAQIIVIFLAIGIHEYAHCKFADLAGDPTPGIYGRVTLNLFKHFDPFGAMMILFTTLSGFGIGWGRPAPMDPRKMRDPKWDFFTAVLAGPLSNVAQAILWAIIGVVVRRLGLVPGDDFLAAATGSSSSFFSLLVLYGVMTNIALAIFNLIPLGPLDGHWLVGILLPDPIDIRWYRFNRQVGTYALMGLVLFGQVSHINIIGSLISKPASAATVFLLGLNK